MVFILTQKDTWFFFVFVNSDHGVRFLDLLTRGSLCCSTWRRQVFEGPTCDSVEQQPQGKICFKFQCGSLLLESGSMLAGAEVLHMESGGVWAVHGHV